MTIKEVERLTGLSAKTIRYYEKEGLLQVKRDKRNSYRNYSEEDVAVLKKIKLFRYLEFSVAETKTILNAGSEETSKQLHAQAEALQEQGEKCLDKRDLCLSLSKDFRKNTINPDEYGDILDFYEDEEIQALLNKLAAPSISQLIITAIIYLAPIIWLFLNIHEQHWELLPLNAVFALIATVILTLECRSYQEWRTYRSLALKQKNQKDKREIRRILPGIIAGLAIVVFLSLTVIRHMFNKLLVPDDWLFYQFQSPEILIALLPLIAVIFFGCVINRLLNRDKIHIARASVCFIILLASVYLCFTNVVFVTANSIVCCSPANPQGTTYQYKDVEKAEAKFGARIFALNDYEKKGSFQYAATLDGKKYIFSVPTPNPDIKRYEQDTYLELEELDAALMALNIPKESSAKNSEYCDLDDRYRDRFLRIIKSRNADE